jgi:chromatin segregation and condensation protein Rec8/ScpA/Scc1 (kleisin family)
VFCSAYIAVVVLTSEIISYSSTNHSQFTNAIMLVAIASTLMVVASTSVFNNSNSLLPMANAQKPDNEFGAIASIQNGKDG